MRAIHAAKFLTFSAQVALQHFKLFCEFNVNIKVAIKLVEDKKHYSNIYFGKKSLDSP